MRDFLTYKLYLTGWDQSHVRAINPLWSEKQVDLIWNMSNELIIEHLILHLQVNHAMVHFDKDTDIITGLKQKTQYGRPNWDKEFEQVRQENPS